MRRRHGLSIGVVILGTCLALAPRASAHDFAVIVVDESTHQDTEELETQLRSELTTAGFNVLSMTTDREMDEQGLRRIASTTGSDAVVFVRWSPKNVAAEVWVVSPSGLTGAKKTLAPLALDRDDVTASFAIKTSELVRGAMLELRQAEAKRAESETTGSPKASTTPSPPASAPSTAPLPQPNAPPPPRPEMPMMWSARLGVSVLGGPGGIPPGVAPSLAVARTLNQDWSVEIQVLGPAVGTVPDQTGTAHTDQEILVGKVQFQVPVQPIAPFANAGLGFYRLGVRGVGTAPFVGESGAAMSGIGAVGLGVRARGTSMMSFSLEVDGMFTTSRPAIVFADRESAQVARPIILGTAGLEIAW